MRILVVSDTHRFDSNFYQVLENEEVDMVIHCGDSEGSEFEYQMEVRVPMIMVAGNNDFFTELPKEREFNLGNYKVLLTHGHYYYVVGGNQFLKDEARARSIDIVIYGHTHIPLIEEEQDLIVINPGSISYPRQSGREPSYIIMEIDEQGDAYFELRYL